MCPDRSPGVPLKQSSQCRLPAQGQFQSGLAIELYSTENVELTDDRDVVGFL
jgi:hypothetical protein